jgi:hypothetical protein
VMQHEALSRPSQGVMRLQYGSPLNCSPDSLKGSLRGQRTSR